MKLKVSDVKERWIVSEKSFFWTCSECDVVSVKANIASVSFKVRLVGFGVLLSLRRHVSLKGMTSHFNGFTWITIVGHQN